MARLLPVRAEIAGGRNEGGAKMVLPDTIDHHARGQRILRRGNPIGEIGPARLRFETRQHNGKARRHFFAFLGIISTIQNMRRGGFVVIGNGHRLRERRRFWKRFDFGDKLFAMISLRCVNGGVDVGVGDFDFVFGFQNEVGLFRVALVSGRVVGHLGLGGKLRN